MALRAGDRPRSERHFLRALWLAPGNVGALQGLLETADAEEERVLRAHALADAVADERGLLRLDNAMRRLLGPDAPYRSLTGPRAALAGELARAAARLKPGDPPAIARWIAELGAELGRLQPSLDAKYGRTFADAVERVAPKPLAVVAALQAAIDAAFGKGRPEEALRAARILRGLARQASFEDRVGPAPDLASAEASAVAAIEKAREQLRAREPNPLPSIADLEALPPDETVRWNEAHSDPANPGVVMSPTGLYRVETICGLETLLVTAKQVELHHRRLADWMGRDPFVGRPGLVRIVPEASDLEREGAPYWWAGGFQGGDVTTLRFAHGTGEGLGHGLVHELTHRFDGALHPGMPAWLAEGRAVWTGGAYGDSTDESFVQQYASMGALSETWRGGVSPESVEKLITGNLDDYRENYTAGHALWVYLWSWQPGEPKFRARIPAYLEGLGAGKGGKEGFVASFADGADSRPKGFEAFVDGFREFVRGFWWETRQPFARSYVDPVRQKGVSPFVYDAPTWGFARERAEPTFGQDQATAAGRLLAEIATPAAAIAALEWALEQDEIDADVARLLASLYERTNRPEAAWAVRARLHRRRPDAEPPPDPYGGPFLASPLARYQSLLAAYVSSVEPHRAAGRNEVAAALAADHDRLAALGARPALAAVPLAPAGSAGRTQEVCEPPFAAGAHGYAEDRLKDFEKFRSRGEWHAGESGDLVLGRRGGGPQTGLQRAAWVTETFVRGSDWLSGSYGISARVRFLTSFVSGAMIVGWQRHDRQFRVGFSAGDWAYATGRKEEEGSLQSVNISFGDLREREGPGSGLKGTQGSRSVSLPPGSTSFQLDVLVDGAFAHVFVNGARVGSHRAATGLPIEGYAGFASRDGILQMETPSVRVHRRVAGEDRCGCRTWPVGLDLGVPQDGSWTDLLGLPVRGVPRAPRGAALLWIPEVQGLAIGEGDLDVESAIALVRHLVASRRQAGLDAMPIVAAIPESLGAEKIERVRSESASALAAGDAIVVRKPHLGHRKLMEEIGHPADLMLAGVIFFVDPDGVARTQNDFKRSRGLPRDFLHWASVVAGRRSP